ncbi:S8 family serine peptidase [Pseudooceanicola sp.]|uniref:S8 family serine peptidase n=1 Tax=Pseudooceanicola sp. TaxID=1914328 RepID=UPI0035C67512
MALSACVAADGGPNQSLRLAQGPAASTIVDPQELIVLTADAPQVLISRARTLGYRLKAVYPLPDLDDTLVVFRIPDGTSIPQAIEEIEEAVPAVTAGAHHVYRLQASARGERDYAAAMIAWPKGGCRAHVRVGMLDNGVAPDHPGLRDGRIAQRAFTGSDAPPASDHATLLAELLVGPDSLRNTTLFSANVVDPAFADGEAAGVVSILRGMDWLASNGVNLVNISLAGPKNKLMNRALGQAAQDGIILVAAVGNAGADQPPQYPAAFPFALAVTAVDRDGAVYRNAVRGPHVDIAAPGVDVLIPKADGVKVSSGTSIAAPFVTRVVAADATLARKTASQLRTELARRATDVGAPGRDEVFGAGVVRAQSNCVR